MDVFDELENLNIEDYIDKSWIDSSFVFDVEEKPQDPNKDYSWLENKWNYTVEEINCSHRGDGFTIKKEFKKILERAKFEGDKYMFEKAKEQFKHYEENYARWKKDRYLYELKANKEDMGKREYDWDRDWESFCTEYNLLKNNDSDIFKKYSLELDKDYYMRTYGSKYIDNNYTLRQR